MASKKRFSKDPKVNLMSIDDFLGLSKYKDLSNCKQYTYKDLYWLFDKLNDFMFYTMFFALGYIPLDKNENNNFWNRNSEYFFSSSIPS